MFSIAEQNQMFSTAHLSMKVRNMNKKTLIIAIVSVIALCLSIVTLLIVLFPKGLPINFETETQRADHLEASIKLLNCNCRAYAYVTNETQVNQMLIDIRNSNFTLCTVNEATFFDIVSTKLSEGTAEMYGIMRSHNTFYFFYEPYPPYPKDYQTVYTCTP
jgi:hypothetical protein